MIDPVTIGLALASQFAPSIIQYFTDSETAGQVAGKVIDIAKTVTGKDGPGEAMAALRADPALAMQFQQAVMAQETELERLYLADRKDARARDVAMAQAGQRNIRADVMVAVDAIGLIVCLIVLALYRQDMPGEVVTLISTIASIFGLCLRDAHQYEFGSSRGSKEKADAISRMKF